MRPELQYLLPSNAYRVRPPSDWRMFPRDDSPGCVKSSHRICPCQQYQGCWVWSRAYNVKSSDEQLGSVDVVVSQDLLCVSVLKINQNISESFPSRMNHNRENELNYCFHE